MTNRLLKEVFLMLKAVKFVSTRTHRDLAYAVEAFRAGASGYVLKNSAAQELVTAIQEALKDRVYVTPLVAKDLLHALMADSNQPEKPSFELTPRQREVFQLVAEGHSAKEIAGILHVSPRTAEFHKYQIMEKIGLRTTAELVQYAIKHGIVSV